MLYIMQSFQVIHYAFKWHLYLPYKVKIIGFVINKEDMCIPIVGEKNEPNDLKFRLEHLEVIGQQEPIIQGILQPQVHRVTQNRSYKRLRNLLRAQHELLILEDICCFYFRSLSIISLNLTIISSLPILRRDPYGPRTLGLFSSSLWP